MNYSDDSKMCRVDFFKEHGKWYCTEAVDFTGHHTTLVHETVRAAVLNHLDGRLAGMWAVCLDPSHPNGYPIMFKIPE